MAPDSGIVSINGHRIDTDSHIIRRQMGVCMQDDTVYDNMTGYEHMVLYTAIKGVPKRFMKHEIKSKLESVGLWDERNKLVTSYSGGMKRRLTFALAILGNPRIVVLDECTAGTDPSNRQRIWQILQNMRQRPGTTILMTSHSMEEVDLLCDTIAVMKRGKLEVVGSSLQLKQHFGVGYHLSCELREDVQDLSDEQRDAIELQLRQFVQDHFPDVAVQEPAADEARLSDSIHEESMDRLHYSHSETLSENNNSNTSRARRRRIQVVLPYSSVGRFPTFLRELEARMDGLQIASYDLNITTLEEVFLRINEETGQDEVE